MAVMGRVTPGCHPRARCLLLTAIPAHAGNDMLLVMLAAVDAAVTTAWGGVGGGGASSLEYGQRRRVLRQNVNNDILFLSVDNNISARGPLPR